MHPTHPPQTVSMPLLRLLFGSVLLAALGALGGCGSLLPKPPPPPAYFSLMPVAAAPRTVSQTPNATAPTLLVQLPRAAAGMDSTRIIYSRQTTQLEYFARSEWVDSPARMLLPLMVQALQQRDAFGAVVQAPSAAIGELRLETVLLSLQHNFGVTPSRVRLLLSAQLIDDSSHRVLATRQIETSADASSEDAAGGVAAAQQAVQQALDQLADFCVATARNWRPAAPRR